MHDARDRNQGIWVEHNDRLYIAAYSSVASLSVMFSGYFRKENGEIQEYAVTVNPTSDRAVTATSIYFGAGFLLSCVATLASGNANRGQCYIRAQIQRSTGTPAIKLHNVLGGYVTDDYSPSFPYGKIEGPLEGPGMIRNVTGSNPAAGAEIAETVPTGARWRLMALRFVLVTDATVANRNIFLSYDDGTTLFYDDNLSDVFGASSSGIVSRAVQQTGRNPSGASGAAATGVPHIFLMAGYRLTTFTLNLQAADNYAAPQLLVEEWIEA